MSAYSIVKEFADSHGFDYEITRILIKNTSVVIGYEITLLRGKTKATHRVSKLEIETNGDLIRWVLNEMNRAFIKAGK